MCKTDGKYSSSGISLTSQQGYSAIMSKLLSINKFTEKLDTEVQRKISELRNADLVLERKMIVKAMGFKQGHWYKCPNGHIYVIADCGGANQGGTCNECKAAIGGQNHRLADGNTLAPEMDGASRSAWS